MRTREGGVGLLGPSADRQTGPSPRATARIVTSTESTQLAGAPTTVERRALQRPERLGESPRGGEAPLGGAGRPQASLRLLKREAWRLEGALAPSRGQRLTVDWSRSLEGSAIAQGTSLPRDGPHRAEPPERRRLQPPER